MSHPYRGAGRSGAKLKFSKMLGTTKGAKHMNDDSVESPNATVRSGVDDVKIMASPPPKRLDRARGGKVHHKGGGKAKTVVNVIVPPGGGGGMPPLPPLGPMAGPGGPMPPMMPKPPMPGGPVPASPGVGLPLPKARGGYISGKAKSNQLKQWAQYARKNSYHKKSGGGISGKYGLKAGAETGEGRLEISKLSKRKH